MTTEVKKFGELTTKELYSILQLRTAVFVVEQQCVYQDMDGLDELALHLLGKEGDKLTAYTRIFGPGDYFEVPSIGRVVVHPDARKKGYGKEIMEASIQAVESHFNTRAIVLSAQSYLRNFYRELGFREKGEEYLEDGILHIKMYRK